MLLAEIVLVDTVWLLVWVLIELGCDLYWKHYPDSDYSDCSEGSDYFHVRDVKWVDTDVLESGLSATTAVVLVSHLYLL